MRRVKQGRGKRLLAKVPSGTYLALTQDGGDWYGVLMADHSTGWIARSDVKILNYEVVGQDPPERPRYDEGSTEPLLGGTELKFGVRFRFWGARPGGAEITWVAQVMDVDEPRRIELSYVSGDLLGRVAWELEPTPEGTRVSFVYRGVRPNSPAAEANFRHFGTRLHSISMREDAFAGLAHHVAGTRADLDEESWRAHVLARVPFAGCVAGRGRTGGRRR